MCDPAPEIKTPVTLQEIGSPVLAQFKPSSKTCSKCGIVKLDLTLADRTFKCECGHIEDRDLNAANNIMNFSRAELARINASGEQVNRHSLKEESSIKS